jgi:hypothetical protein
LWWHPLTVEISVKNKKVHIFCIGVIRVLLVLV